MGSPMESIDVTIIGAGVIGLAIASEISRPDRNVFLLEKNDSWGQEASSRNSEVIHAGIYYQPGSLKALSCLEGRRALYKICSDNNIPAKKIGKIIVAVDDSEIQDLQELQKNASENGVVLDFLEKGEVKKIEPKVSCSAALYSRETGIIDSHALMELFLKKAEANNASIAYRAQVLRVSRDNSKYEVKVNNSGEEIKLSSTVVINCAGLNADKIAHSCGIDVAAEGYKQYYLKGNYFRLTDKFRNTTKHLVYPVPGKKSLGIHTVLDLSGGIRLGPDEEEVQEIDYRVNESRKKMFYDSVKKFLPHIEEDQIHADMAGIRPQLFSPNKGDFRDFIISHEEKKGFPGLINLIGIESPGLTASPFIARYVADIVEKLL